MTGAGACPACGSTERPRYRWPCNRAVNLVPDEPHPWHGSRETHRAAPDSLIRQVLARLSNVMRELRDK